MHVKLKIENHYEEIETVVTEVAADVPYPEPDEDDPDHEEWAYDNLYPFTGTGHETGDSAYFVTVTECEDMPALVGTEFEWGT